MSRCKPLCRSLLCVLLPICVAMQREPVVAVPSEPAAGRATAPGKSHGIAALVGIVPAARPAPVVEAQQDTERAVELTERAADLIRRERFNEALELLQRAVEADDTHWEAYYQQGRIFGMREDYLMARHMLLRASELNPGHAHTHRLAWEAAYRIGDYENAWDQAIRASLAGIDMNQRFLEMYGVSEPPEDFELRMNAPRIYVAALTLDDIEALNQLPFNRNPASGGVGTISGRPDFAEGINRANENAFNLHRVRASAREAIFRMRYLGLVLDLELADYVLGISVESLGAGAPVTMEGYLRLYDARSGETVYYRALSLRDISSDGLLFGEMQRHMTDLEAWSLERVR